MLAHAPPPPPQKKTKFLIGSLLFSSHSYHFPCDTQGFIPSRFLKSQEKFLGKDLESTMHGEPERPVSVRLSWVV